MILSKHGNFIIKKLLQSNDVNVSKLKCNMSRQLINPTFQNNFYYNKFQDWFVIQCSNVKSNLNDNQPKHKTKKKKNNHSNSNTNNNRDNERVKLV